jgi:putative membrane protein
MRHMNGLFIRWIVNAAALWLTSEAISGIQVSGIGPLLLAAVVLGILNAVLRPVLLLLTLPINILTLGLFTFVLNGFMLKLASGLVPGFDVHGFWASVFGALLLSFFSFLLSLFVSDRGRVEYVHIERRA